MRAPRGWMLLALTAILTCPSFAGSHNRPLKVASLDFDRAVFDTEDGKRGVEELSRKLEPKQVELKDNLKQRLKDHSANMTDADRTSLQSQIDSTQKSLDSSTQNVREESQTARRNLRDIIIRKMAPTLIRFAQQKQLDAILDVSTGAAHDPGKFWPDGLVLWTSGPDIDLKEASSTKRESDITDSVVQKYNAAHP